MSEKVIEFKNVNKWYGKFHVLKDINLYVNKSEKIIICGPSGSGKSTLIRCINGLEQHQDGNIIVQGNELDKTLKNVEKISITRKCDDTLLGLKKIAANKIY